MTAEVVQLLTAAETAAILRKLLGPARQWRDFLADAIRGRSNLHGQVLLPFAARAGGMNLVPRQLYRGKDVANFVQAVRLADPTLGPKPFSATKFKVDTTPGLVWHTRIAKLES